MLEMNPEIRKQWTDALRSGEYKQARHNLRVTDESGTNSYCCLGVLCDLYIKAGNPETYQVEGETFDIWEECTLPVSVSEWAGLDGDNNPVLQDVNGEIHMASGWNDSSGGGFNKIADMIDGGQS